MNTMRIFLFGLFAFIDYTVQADVNHYFNQIKQDSNSLYAFLKKMPKGGELHYHLGGGAYPEVLLEVASKENYCLQRDSYQIVKTLKNCDGIQSKDIYNHPEFYAETIKAWSLKDFVPGKESGFEHFFKTFDKYQPIINEHAPELLAHIMKRAAEQKENYLEIMLIPDDTNSMQFSTLISPDQPLEEKKTLLLENKAFRSNIKHAVSESERLHKQAYERLGCSENPKNPGCTVQIKFIFFVLREQSLDKIFAQALTAFTSVAESKGALVGVNLVQREHDLIAMRDYRKQMEIFKFLHRLYPQVSISLHAGEFAPEFVTPENLGYHIHDAVFIGAASRIGHGVDIAYENNAVDTLKYMADQQIAVEINLSSNEKILNSSGKNHPLRFYLAHQVPVVLSTDDEGILRTDLTREYMKTVLNHGLNYPVLKQINRNALTYSFLPGKSIWGNPRKAELIAPCQDLESPRCQDFVKNNEKAKLQRRLELQLANFEQDY